MTPLQSVNVYVPVDENIEGGIWFSDEEIYVKYTPAVFIHTKEEMIELITNLHPEGVLYGTNVQMNQQNGTPVLDSHRLENVIKSLIG